MNLVVQETGLHLVQDPEEAIASAQKAAKALMQVVNTQKLYVELRGNKHLLFEAWQTVGYFYGITAGIATPEDVQDVYDNGLWIGARAYATVYHKGQKIGGADAICYQDEPGKEEMAQFQIRSMAQTRAMAKAYRSILAFVAVLAGYSPTPAEEMTQEGREATMDVPKCPKHPRRKPLEWGGPGKGPELWKCTAKVDGGGYCTWSAPRVSTPTQPVASAPTPVVAVPQGDGAAMPWTVFWPQAYALVGSQRQDDVNKALGVASILKEWIGNGYTKEEALYVLAERTTGRLVDQIITEDLPPRSNDDTP